MGQANPGVAFLARWPGHALFLTSAGPSVRTPDSAWKMDFVGANPLAVAIGLDTLEARSHYLIGSQLNWHTNVPLYGRVKYRNVYPGVDFVYYGDEAQVRYDLILDSAAEPSQVRLRFESAGRIRFDTKGELSGATGRGEWWHSSLEASASVTARSFHYGRRGILDLTHTRLFTVSSFRRLLRNAGFRIDSVRCFGPQ